MAFPTALNPASGNSAANVSTTTLTNPGSSTTGDLIIGIACKDGTGVFTVDAASTGWTQLNNAANTSMLLGCWWKILDGSGDTLILTHASEGTAWVTYRIPAGTFDSATAPAFLSGAGANANPDPPSLNPATWDIEDTLWIAAYGWDGNVSHTTYPSGYTSNQATSRWANTGGCGIAAATRESAAATENPGTATLSGSEEWRAFTIGVRPGVGVTTHFGASTGTLVFTGTTAATKKTFGVSTGTIVFTGTTAARRKALGASTGTLVFTATTAGRRKALGVSSGTIVFTATTAGAVAGAIKFGASSATITFTGTTAARKKTFGVSTGTVVFTGTTVARKKTFGVSTGTIVITGTTAAFKKTFAVSTGRVTFTATTAATAETPITFVFRPYTSRNRGRVSSDNEGNVDVDHAGRVSSLPEESQLTSAEGGRMGVTDG